MNLFRRYNFGKNNNVLISLTTVPKIKRENNKIYFYYNSQTSVGNALFFTQDINRDAIKFDSDIEAEKEFNDICDVLEKYDIKKKD